MHWDELTKLLAKNRLLQAILSFTSLIATYLQYYTSGVSWLFWMLLAITIAAVIWSVGVYFCNIFQQRIIDKARLYYDHKDRINTLTRLVQDFDRVEKSIELRRLTKPNQNIRLLSIIPIEREVGVIINIGKRENVQVGTHLIVYRIDSHTSDGKEIEQLWALIEVTYVQAENNCSQARIINSQDESFWRQIQTRLQKGERRIDPPRNFVTPYVPAELESFSGEQLRSFRSYFETVRHALIQTEQIHSL